MPKKPGTSEAVTIDPSIHTQKADRTVKQSNPVNFCYSGSFLRVGSRS